FHIYHLPNLFSVPLAILWKLALCLYIAKNAKINVVIKNCLLKLGVISALTIGADDKNTIDPSDTNLVIKLTVIPSKTQIMAVGQWNINIAPNDVATPLPPLNPIKTGQLCPITANKPPI